MTHADGGSSIVFHRCGDGYGVSLVSVEDGVVARQDYPLRIAVRDADGAGDIPAGVPVEREYTSEYDAVSFFGDSVVASGRIETDGGSVFVASDTYLPVSDGSFLLKRHVSVEAAGTDEAGFASSVCLSAPLANGCGSGDFEYFLPSILYKDASNLRRGTVASDLRVDRLYVKETRMGVPLAMLRSKKSGSTFAMVHHRPEVSVGPYAGGGVDREVNDSLRFGSIGYGMSRVVSVDFRYPSCEGPATYEPGVRRDSNGEFWSRRFHTVRAGNTQDYSLLLVSGNWSNCNDAISDVFSRAYEAECPEVADVCMDSVYLQNIHLFKSEYREFGTGAIRAAGVPWSLFLPDGDCRDGYSFQMGFVGQQLPVGYHLYRYGLDNSDAEAVRMGKAIVDFWTSEIFTGTYFPTVWWDPADNESAGRRREYPSFLRCMVDGMEGLLDACRIADAYGVEATRWRDALNQMASHLVDKQNDDGSFYRAYRTDGNVETGGDRNTFGDSKLNTPIAVRFLVKMYEWSGDERFRVAAIKGADFAYEELYRKLGKYVGGTPDNPNTVDKEAAVYALHAFNAVHQLTGDSRYLEAAEHAANCAMSWVYCYDFAIPDMVAADKGVNPFVNGGVRGFSLISTGHSGADNYMAYAFYEFFKLYVKTGKECYRHMAWQLQNDTKLCTDFDGRMNYRYRALMPEATNVADLAFRSVRVWLPWASIANIEPIVQMEETFGCNDVTATGLALDDLRARLDEYGSGGKPIRRRR